MKLYNQIIYDHKLTVKIKNPTAMASNWVKFCVVVSVCSLGMFLHTFDN